ncbi:puromycin-sensitive aminopeptidase [Pancytospora philotis]|nr:puromycin-sensitive aminopeptidase [Pancytospora philotis]
MREWLTRDVLPVHYDLSVAVEESGFAGAVQIRVRPEKPVSSFKINAHELRLGKMRVDGEEVKYTQDEDFVTIQIGKEKSEEFDLVVEYAGEFRAGEMQGFYKSDYRGDALYSTHFEPTHARAAFPCFDQPDMKATYSVKIRAPPGYTALSNGALERKEDGNLFVFRKTPKMSTYIVAFVVGKLDYREVVMKRTPHEDKHNDGDKEEDGKRHKSNRSGSVPIRVYAHEKEADWGKFSLDVAERCLAFFERYFEVDYPLDKLDMVAIPSFAMGAMENWGLVTYRSTSLLYNEKTTSMRSKKNIAVTVCHELAHMWFGNLVTMEWWDDLWLNEGFATWAATLAIANSLGDIFDWEAWTSFINDEIEAGMEMDYLRSTHKIGVTVEKPSEIDQIFDAISYSKGSSIIKMTESWLGAETFRRGLARYLKKHSYGNSTTKDLWDALSEECRQRGNSVDVASVIDPWVAREGFPVVTATDKGSEILLEQTRFTMDPKERTADPWPIPIKIRWGDGSVSDLLMTSKTAEVKKTHAVYKINDSAAGFYRVNYASNNASGNDSGNDASSPFDNLFKMDLDASNRMQIFNDAFAIAEACLGPIPASHLAAERNENNYDVLLSVTSSLTSLASIFYDKDDIRSAIQAAILSLVADRAAAIDLRSAGKSVDEISLNSLIVSEAVRNDDPAMLKAMKKILDSNGDPAELLRSPAPAIHPEYVRQFYTAAANDHFDDLFGIYKDPNAAGLKQHALIAITAVSRPDLIEALLSRFREVQPHDSVYLFAGLARNFTARNTVAAFFIKNYSEIAKHINEHGLVRHAIENTFASVLQDDEREKAVAFLESIRSDPNVVTAVNKSLDGIASRMRFRDSREKEVSEAFRK